MTFKSAVIYIPDFHLQAALRLEPELRTRPVALMDGQLPKAAVWQMTPAAQAAGICPKMTSTQAMARCRDVVIKMRSPAQEQAAREALLQCAYCFSPAIEDTGDGVCTMDIERVACDYFPWAQRILSALAQLPLDARVGLAQTPHLAWQAAKMANPILLAENADDFIANLPIINLDPPADIAGILEKWGIRTTGAFLALGKEKIAERLGPEGVELFDVASSREVRPLKQVVPAETFAEGMDFEEPLEMLEPLLFVLRRFIEQLARRLEAIYLVAGEIELQLGLASGDKYERLFHIPAPTSDVDTLFRMLHTHLENVRTASPITSLRLCAAPARPTNDQLGLFDAALRDPNQFHETLARLSAFLDHNRAGTPHLEDSHRPDSFQMDPAALVEHDGNFDFSSADLDTAEKPRGLCLRRFRPPVPASVQLRQSHPVLLNSALFTGAITHTRGPWRLSGHWWDVQTWARDEWDVQTRDGGLYRLVCQNEQWFVEGIFD